jgi:hypothetical protein
LLFSTNAEFLNDLEEAPETEDDDERRDFFQDTMKQDIYYESRKDYGCVKGVEPRVEVPVYTLTLSTNYSLQSGELTSNQKPKHSAPILA